MDSSVRICAASSGVALVGAADAEPGVAGNRQRQPTHDERQQRQEDEVAAVGDDQPDLAAGDRGELAAHAGVRRGAQIGRADSAGGRRRRPVAGQEAAVGLVGVGAHLGEDVGPVGGSHGLADLAGRAQERRLAAGRHQQHLIADVEVGQRVRDHQHHATGVGQLPQHRHDLQVQRGVQARGRLVEDQQRRPGEQFECHRGALALAAGELVDPGVGVLGQPQFLEYLGDDLFAVGLAGVGRQPQFGGVAQRLVDGQLAVHDVVLGDHPDPGAQRRVLGVDVVALEGDRAGAGRWRIRRSAATAWSCRRRTRR